MKFWSQAYQQKLISPELLIAKVNEIRSLGQTIVTLNGSFDLMHAGHLQIIYEASLQAEILIVALNSDSSIKAYKSLDRPIIPLEYRLQLMAALEFVDYVTWFEEPDPLRLLNDIKPNVHANGSEYGENCIEAEVVKRNGGKIHVVELVKGLSTSQILNKIASIAPQGR